MKYKKILYPAVFLLLIALTIGTIVSQNESFSAEGFADFVSAANLKYMVGAALSMLCYIMMEGMGGIEVLKRIRNQKETKDLPVILLTARGEEIDKVLGLEMGADDYMAKPFGVHELAARIKAVFRRSQRTTADEEREHKDSVHAGRLTIDKETREAMVDGKPLDLALKEFELLYLLVKNKGFVFSRDQALEQVWGYDYFGETRTVDVHIRNIRKKLEEKGMNPDCIKTVRGVGYKFQQEES